LLNTRHDPLLLPFLAVALGILAARYADLDVRELLAALAALGALTAIAAWRRLRLASASGVLATALLGGALAGVADRPEPPADLAAQREAAIAGCVVAPPVAQAGRQQLIVELRPGVRALTRVYLRAGEAPPAIGYGDRVRIEARLRPPRNFGNPGAFDYAGYLARQRVFALASVRGAARVRKLPGECGSAGLAAIYGVRERALERVDRLYPGDAYTSSMMRGLLLGDDSRIDDAWTEGYRHTGTYHALVVSGLHVTVLAGMILLLLRVCGARSGWALALAAAFAWFYALLAGGSPPVVRAAAGMTMFFFCRWFYRRARILNLLAAVAIVFLLIDPPALFDASFQLSFLAVAVIGAVAAPWIERRSAPYARALGGLADRDRDLRLEPRAAAFRVELRLLAETVALWTRLPKRWASWALSLPLRAGFWVHDLAVVSALMQIGLALPMALSFHRVSLTAVSANLPVAALLNLAIPVGFLAVLTGWTLPAAAAQWLLASADRAVAWHAALEPHWRVPDPPWWLAATVIAALVACAFTLRAGRFARAAAVSGLAAAALTVAWHPFSPRVQRGELELSAIDVGQGDALLVALPAGELMLVDGGGLPDYGGHSRLDIGEDVVSPYLWSRSIRRLDVVAVTHAHRDHAGGLAAVVEAFRPREVWVGTAASAAPPELLDAARRARARIVCLEQGDRFELGGAFVDVAAPLRGYPASLRPRNDDSLVLRLSYGRHSFLLTGDIEAGVEASLVNGGALARADVLKVAHHGSRSSTTEPFLDLVRPAFAIVSAGADNAYGFPHREVIERLERRGARVFRTDRDGLVTIRSDGWRLRAE
jgi:competence protein ComEC